MQIYLRRNLNSCRFIFVHFNAWEYNGCDILWAGIVTNLASAIEAEFGVKTSRIFRSLTVDVIQNDASSNERKIFFDVPNGITTEEFKEVLTEYGTVKPCKKRIENGKVELKEVKQGENHNGWLVECSNAMEAAKARKAWKSLRLKTKAKTKSPKNIKQKKNKKNKNETSRK